MGLADRLGSARYHEVVNRACWNSRAVARTFSVQVLGAFLPAGEVVVGIKPRGRPNIGDMIECRWSIRIPVRPGARARS